MASSPTPDSSPDKRRVVLPSGKTIEVVYFNEAGGTQTVTEPARDLHVCPECRSELVYPVSWADAGEQAWELDLRCPNCEWEHTAVYDQEVVEALDVVLDDGTQALVTDLRSLVRANMEAEVDRFIAALQADAIWPIDF
jgi:predicted ATP-dependent serine protease